MQIVQSCWSRNQKSFLSSNAGWLAPEYHLMGWALSSLQLRKFHDELTLYTDSVSARILIDKLQLPYTNVVCSLDKINNYHPDLWAIPKIQVYSEQEEPFLHIDGDVFIWKRFDDELLSQGLITQNKETATGYYENIMRSLENELTYFPEEIIAERKKQGNIEAYNAGIFGGSDIAFFKEYTSKAFYFIEKNTNQLHKINVSDFNIFFEQYLFYCLSKHQEKKISVLFDKIYEDYGYSGFGNFCEVPYERDYLHLLGTFKRHKQICADMASRLRHDFPEYYYRIIQLCYDNNIKLEQDHYSHLPSKTEYDLLSRYHFLKQPDLQQVDSDAEINHIAVNWRRRVVDDFLNGENELNIPKVIEKRLKKDVTRFEEEIGGICNSKFLLINKDYLYQRDVLGANYLEFIFGNKDKITEKKLVVSKFEIISSKYNWSILDEQELPLKKKFQKLQVPYQLKNYFAIVPECNAQRYSVASIDELDRYILKLLKRTMTIGELMGKVAEQFDPEELENAYDDFQLLIYGRIKMALLCKLIKSADTL